MPQIITVDKVLFVLGTCDIANEDKGYFEKLKQRIKSAGEGTNLTSNNYPFATEIYLAQKEIEYSLDSEATRRGNLLIRDEINRTTERIATLMDAQSYFNKHKIKASAVFEPSQNGDSLNADATTIFPTSPDSSVIDSLLEPYRKRQPIPLSSFIEIKKPK